MEVQQVRDEVLIFLRAGHESTSAALTFTLHLLHDEIDAVLDWRPPTVDDAPALDRSAMVIKEAMRLYPPAYAVGRQAESDRQIGAYTIPGRLDRRPQPIRDAPPSRLLGQPRGVHPTCFTPGPRSRAAPPTPTSRSAPARAPASDPASPRSKPSSLPPCRCSASGSTAN
jgi:Cytochrome P450